MLLVNSVIVYGDFICINIDYMEHVHMKKQLQGIAVILVSILFMLGFGNAPFFDFHFRWASFFAIVGVIGAGMTFLPDKK